ncbi:zinc finger protein 426-like [Culex pipiens pallens]|uniref:zinc finger protein 426-like n=1 Tax=Culex pipiens pallens TaxID=42434 RepID=UPI00195496DE|nr:zinc finger protein 426-like [Culex pipiens pallens]XP_039429111.1 zinc finger protein 426-like [Culex pipiens pallens]
MAIFALDQFPDVCRMCVQPKPVGEMIPLESITLEGVGSQTLLQLLNRLTFEASKDISDHLPRAICSGCFSTFEFVCQYQAKATMTGKLLVALASLKLGNEGPIVRLFGAERDALVRLIRELNLCSKEEVLLQDFLEQFKRKKAPVQIKLENDATQQVVRESKPEDVEYYNVEYIEEDGSASVQRHHQEEAKEDPEPFAEFLEDPEEPEEFLQDEHEESLESNEQPQKIRPKTRMMQCSYCKYRTTSQEMFQSHVDRHENPDDRNPWKCSFANCDEVYPTKDELLRHKKEMHSKYVCDICGLVLKHKYTLEVHLRRHKGESKYPCQYCRTAYFTSNELKLHMSVVHLSLVDFQCNDCGLAFKNKKSLLLHSRTHSEQRSYQCEECDMSFKTSAHLRRHHNTVHRAIKFSCSLCSVSYGRKDKLRMHMERTHNIQTYFPCDICLKSFSSAADLAEHKAHHARPKELECATCLVAFLNRKEFDDHLCITYRDSYECCGRDFKFHLHFNKHMFLAHGLKTNVRVKPAANQLMSAVRAARKPVERCVRCGRVFPTRKLKKEHMQQCAELIPFGEEEVLDEVGMGQQLQQQQQQVEYCEVVDGGTIRMVNAVDYQQNIDQIGPDHMLVKLEQH